MALNSEVIGIFLLPFIFTEMTSDVAVSNSSQAPLFEISLAWQRVMPVAGSSVTLK